MLRHPFAGEAPGVAALIERPASKFASTIGFWYAFRSSGFEADQLKAGTYAISKHGILPGRRPVMRDAWL